MTSPFADMELDPLERSFGATEPVKQVPLALVDSGSEAHREQCEARWLKQQPFDRRQRHLAGVKLRRGEMAAARLASLSNEP